MITDVLLIFAALLLGLGLDLGFVRGLLGRCLLLLLLFVLALGPGRSRKRLFKNLEDLLVRDLLVRLVLGQVRCRRCGQPTKSILGDCWMVELAPVQTGKRYVKLECLWECMTAPEGDARAHLEEKMS